MLSNHKKRSSKPRSILESPTKPGDPCGATAVRLLLGGVAAEAEVTAGKKRQCREVEVNENKGVRDCRRTWRMRMEDEDEDDDDDDDGDGDGDGDDDGDDDDDDEAAGAGAGAGAGVEQDEDEDEWADIDVDLDGDAEIQYWCPIWSFGSKSKRKTCRCARSIFSIAVWEPQDYGPQMGGRWWKWKLLQGLDHNHFLFTACNKSK